jgi:hypothetical protein
MSSKPVHHRRNQLAIVIPYRKADGVAVFFWRLAPCITVVVVHYQFTTQVAKDGSGQYISGPVLVFRDTALPNQ